MLNHRMIQDRYNLWFMKLHVKSVFTSVDLYRWIMTRKTLFSEI